MRDERESGGGGLTLRIFADVMWALIFHRERETGSRETENTMAT